MPKRLLPAAALCVSQALFKAADIALCNACLPIIRSSPAVAHDGGERRPPALSVVVHCPPPMGGGEVARNELSLPPNTSVPERREWQSVLPEQVVWLVMGASEKAEQLQRHVQRPAPRTCSRPAHVLYASTITAQQA